MVAAILNFFTSLTGTIFFLTKIDLMRGISCQIVSTIFRLFIDCYLCTRSSFQAPKSGLDISEVIDSYQSIENMDNIVAAVYSCGHKKLIKMWLDTGCWIRQVGCKNKREIQDLTMKCGHKRQVAVQRRFTYSYLL